MSHVESKVGLSKSVMGMKFMKVRNDSTKLTHAVPTVTVVSNIGFTSQVSLIVKEQTPFTPIEQDLVYIEESVDTLSEMPGRRSFNNFNNSVNKYYSNKIEELNIDKKITSSSSQKGRKNLASDDEIIQKYDQLVGLPRGPNQSRKNDTYANNNTPIHNNHTSKKHCPPQQKPGIPGSHTSNNRNLSHSSHEKYPMKKVR